MDASNSLIDEMSDDAAARAGFPAPSNTDLMEVSALVDEQLRLEREVLAKEEELKSLGEQLRNISRGKLPEALAKFGLTELGLVDGSRVTVKEDVRCGITGEKYDAAMAWLNETGNDDIVKNEVKSTFGKGQDQQARELMDVLNSRGYSYENKRFVHPSTLKAFITDCLRSGRQVPMDTFSVFVDKVSKIVLPRKR